MILGNKLKIVSFDVETTSIIVEAPVWSLYDQNISHKHIKRDWSIICICYKEFGEKTIHSIAITDDEDRKDFLDDYNVIKKFREYLEDVDILIGHNANAFDVKKFNARLAYHRLKPLPKILTIDTLKEARKFAKFTSNRLDYLGIYLGLGNKIVTTPGLWDRVMLEDPRAVKEMVKYCKRDVSLLEDVYIALRPYMRSHPNIASFGTVNCPKCDSDNMQSHKTRITALGLLKKQYQCGDCGSYYTEKSSEKEKSLSKV
jgi:DNA polymerase III epsilon subunit-like protein